MKNKKLTILLIIILSIISIGILIFMVGILTNKINLSNIKFSSNESKELIINETYNIDFNRINIDSEASNIYLKETNDNNTKVIIYGEKDYVKVDTTNNNLNISTKEKNCIGFCFNLSISKIEVYLPVSYDKIIKIENEYGDIEIGSFQNATFEIEEESGDVTVLKANKVTIENEYGDVLLDTINDANIEVSAGDIKIKKVNNIIANNEYGDIEIVDVNNYLNLTNDSGDIKINNVNLNKNSIIKDDYGDIEINNTNEIYIDAKTDLGDVKINNNFRKSDITLKIENECGDITVNN